MRIVNFLLAVSFCFSLFSHAIAQKDVELINSSEVIAKGDEYYQEGEYKKAIEEYKRVSRNDTNYVVSLVELSVAYIQDKQYDKAYEYSLLGLSLKSGYDNNFYNTIAVALKNLEKFEESEKYFKEGLSKFPNNHLMYYNLADLYEKQKKWDLAVKSYQNCIISNPFYSAGHYRLGKIYAVNEKPVQAMMAFQLYLVIDPASESSIEVLKILEETVNNLLPLAEDKDKIAFPADEFDELQLLIKSKVALNKNYKNKTKLNYVLPRQIQLFLEKLTYDAASKDFFMQFYVPYFQAVSKEEFLEPLVYLVYASAQSDEVQSVLKKNLSKIKPFIVWSYNKLDDQRKFRPLVTENPDLKLKHYYYKNNHLQVTGNFKDAAETIRSGEWIFYHNNGALSGKEYYDENGKATGEWISYFNNGVLKGVERYSNGQLHGVSYSCHPNGVKDMEINMVNGKGEGDLKYFYTSGQLRQVFALVNNERQGPELTFFRSGVKESEGNCVKGKREGEYRLYHETGELKEIITLKNDEREGLFKEFLKNGTLIAEGNYKAGLPVGVWRYYHDNGKLSKIGSFTDLGKATGAWKEYFEDGVVVCKEYTLDEKGQFTGPLKEYNKQGKPYTLYHYEADKIKDYNYYNEQGDVISEGKETKGILKMVSKEMDGRIAYTGDYVKGMMSGEWKFYDANGSLEYLNVYKEGKLHGNCVEYYTNGVVFDESTFKNGKLDGLYKSYFRNKNLLSTGWYLDGEKQGDWYVYYPNGKVEKHLYYLNDKLVGYNEYYHPNGKLDYEEFYQHGLYSNTILFDTTGKKYMENPFINGTGEYLTKFPNGNVKCKGKYINGNADGSYTWYYANGKVMMTGAFLHGIRDGKYINYYDNGTKSSDKIYRAGEATGIWNWYYPNGKISKTGHYTNDKFDSTWVYYNENGKKDFVVENRNNLKDGEAIYYNSNEEVVCKKIYKEGRVVAYTYLDKSGNYVPEIKIKDQTVQLVAYYPNGNKSVEETLEKGFYEGKRTFYFSNGQIETVSFYKAHMKEGEDLYYHSNGKVKSRENFFYDELDGKCQYYREDGSIESEGFYGLGEKHGEWKYFDSAGKLIKVVSYWFGQPYEKR